MSSIEALRKLIREEVTKAIIPCVFNGVVSTWWLNKKNPIYKDIIHLGKSGQDRIKVIQTGVQQNTKYVLVK